MSEQEELHPVTEAVIRGLQRSAASMEKSTPDDILRAAEDAGFGEPTLQTLRQNAADWTERQRGLRLIDAAADCAEVALGHLMVATEREEVKGAISVLAGAASLLNEVFAIVDNLGDSDIAMTVHAAVTVIADAGGVEAALAADDHHQFTRVPWVGQMRTAIVILRQVSTPDEDPDA